MNSTFFVFGYIFCLLTLFSLEGSFIFKIYGDIL